MDDEKSTVTEEVDGLSGNYGRRRSDLMMEPEGGHRNSVIKRRNPIEFGLVWFVLTRILVGVNMQLQQIWEKKFVRYECVLSD
ncbi:hypothetical protein EVAR_40625_1 [Eumeta japonica]|uniref:Uncharacterized protein n=1 Tax=Eumeta variegata TaxID=151549 RepID=A0A4C1XI55_EUMVA|nr:hypothetical protein EVAR_40625_1 [Eumeta japonica]